MIVLGKKGLLKGVIIALYHKVHKEETRRTQGKTGYTKFLIVILPCVLCGKIFLGL